jgi:ankyrin repeat protein
MSKRSRSRLSEDSVLSDLESDEESVSHTPKKLCINFLNLFAIVENYNDSLLHVFEFALNRGYNIETQNENGDTLLTYAVKNGVYSLVQFLLTKGGANIEHRNNDNLNALLLSIYTNECYKDINELIEDMEEKIEDIDENKAITEEDKPDPYVSEITKLLVEKYKELGLDLNCTDTNGDTPLIISVNAIKNKALVEYLLNEGRANIEHRNNDKLNALFLSIPNNRIYEEFACSDERVDERVDDISDITKILLKKYEELKLSVDCVDEDGNTPLYVAIKSNESNSLVKLFFKYGANVNHRNKENENALILAIDTVNVLSIVRSVIESGADVNYVDEEGNTPLSYAIQRSSDKGDYMIEILIEYGAKVRYYDKNGDYYDLREYVHPDFLDSDDESDEEDSSEEESESGVYFRPIEVLHDIQN